VSTGTALGLDDTIRAEGQPLGRWSFHIDTDPARALLGFGTWIQVPHGTHDAYEYRGVFYTLRRQIEPGTVDGTSAPATVPGSPTGNTS